MSRDPTNAVVLAFDGLCTFEFGIVVELFGIPRPEFDEWYRLRVAAVHDGMMRAAGGIEVSAPHTIKILDQAGTIIVPGWRSSQQPAPAALIRKLQRAANEGARLLSVCSGAFLLAEAGLLDGKRATTHWKYAEEFAMRYPNVDVDPDVLYVDEGNIITSAGSAAGIDMLLHVVRRDFGAATANVVARRLVMPPSRAGGQKQFIASPVSESSESNGIAKLIDDVRGSLSRDHTIESMARLAHMSKRTFARQFKSVTGMTPHRWLQAERVRLAQELLETTTLTLDRIARRAGFSDTQLLRLHFKRVVGNSPIAYRRAFASR